VIAAAAIAAAVATWVIVNPYRDDRLSRVTVGAQADALARLRARRDALTIGPWAQRRRMHTESRQVQALSALAAELRVGQPPGSALVQSAGTPSAWPVAERAVTSGGDVAAALKVDAAGRDPLASLAVCWQASLRHGAGLADAVDRLAASARASLEVRSSLSAELAGPRATARVLMLLPVIGVVLGMAMGADPVRWLFGTRVGWVCLACGVSLTAVGSLWTSRIAARVETVL
jgi:tight adherence protein B